MTKESKFRRQNAPGNEFQGFAQSESYSPIEIPDVQKYRDRNAATLERGYNRTKERGLKVLDLEYERDKHIYEHNDNVLRILEDAEQKNWSKFSKTLDSLIVTGQKMHLQGMEEEAISLAYEDYMTQESGMVQTQADFEIGEAAAEKVDGEINQSAGDARSQGLPVDVQRRISNLSGFKARVYSKTYLQLAGSQFPAWMATVGRKTEVLNVPGLEGQAITLDSPGLSDAQKMFVQKSVQKKYLGQFAGFSNGALAKYLFPEIAKWDAAEATRYAGEKNKEREEEIIATGKNILSGGIASGDGQQLANSMKEFWDYVKPHNGNSNIVTRSLLEKEMRELVRQRKITVEQFDEAMAAEWIKDDGSVDTVGNVFKNNFHGLREQIINADRYNLEASVQERKNADAKLLDELYTDALQRRKDGKPPITLANLIKINKLFTDKWGVGSDSISRYIANESQDPAMSDALAQHYINDKGYISSAEAEGLTSAAKYKYRQYVDSEGLQSPNKETKSKLDNYAKAITNEKFKMGGLDVHTPASLAYQNAVRRDLYYQYGKEMKTHGDKAKAEEAAVSLVSGKSLKEDSPYTVNLKATPHEERATTVRNALKHYRTVKDWRVKIPGLDNIDWVQIQTAKEIPRELKEIAMHIDGVDAWDLAIAQYKAYTGKDLERPEIEQKAVKALPLTDYQIMTRFPSLANSYQVAENSMTQDEAENEFLKLVISKESEGHGTYDAMNRLEGGTYKGYNSRDVFDLKRGVSEMGIGELMQLQASGKIYAAGAFQIIPTTLNEELLVEAGLSAADTFNKENQNKLALALLRRRLRQDCAVTGVKNEWLGLTKVPDQMLQRYLTNLKYPESRFCQPHNVTPGVIQAAGGL